MFIWIFIFSLQSIHLHIFLIMTIRVDLICSYLHLLSLCFFLSVFFFSLEQKQICLNVHHHTQTPRATCTTRVSRSVKPKPSIWFEFYLYIFYPFSLPFDMKVILLAFPFTYGMISSHVFSRTIFLLQLFLGSAGFPGCYGQKTK